MKMGADGRGGKSTNQNKVLEICGAISRRDIYEWDFVVATLLSQVQMSPWLSILLRK